MASFLLDTNHASPLVTLAHPLRNQILERAASGDMFFLALPSLTELLYGISVIPRARMNLEIWQNLQDSISTLDMQRSDWQVHDDAG